MGTVEGAFEKFQKFAREVMSLVLEFTKNYIVLTLVLLQGLEVLSDGWVTKLTQEMVVASAAFYAISDHR